MQDPFDDPEFRRQMEKNGDEQPANGTYSLEDLRREREDQRRRLRELSNTQHKFKGGL